MHGQSRVRLPLCAHSCLIDLSQTQCPSEDFRRGPTSEQRLHDAGISIRVIAEANENVELVEFLLWGYENGPDSFCRRTFLEQLLERNHCPVDILFEAQWDCADETQYVARAVLAKEESGPPI
jgi:hypothetical protein